MTNQNEKKRPKKTGPKPTEKAPDRRTQEEEEDLDDPILDNDLMLETGSVARTKGRYPIHCLTIVGQIEGHTESPTGTKSTKYEHVIPLLVAIEEDPDIKGLLVILNTVGGDVEAGLAIAELIAGMKKPTVSLVLGGGHSIGIPLAVAAQRSFIVPTATMTVHPVRHTGMVLGVPQTLRHFDRMQERITGFIVDNSNISREDFSDLLMKTGELVLDVGTVLDGEQAVATGLIDEIGSLGDALNYLYGRIDGLKARGTSRKAKSAAAGKSKSRATPRP